MWFRVWGFGFRVSTASRGFYGGLCRFRVETFPRDPRIQVIPVMENQTEQNMEHEMESGDIQGLYRDPSIQIIPTLDPKV